MSYWICDNAEILDDGRSLRLSFKDNHSIERYQITMPAEEWKRINVYKFAHTESHSRIVDLHRELARVYTERLLKADSSDN